MASKVAICNLTLSRIGDEPIMSIDDDSKRARALKGVFDLVRDIVLQEHTWNFATTRSTLALLATTPAFGYSYEYQLPGDCLKPLGLVGSDENVDPDLNYKIEGQKLLTNETTVKLKYIYQVTDTGIFPPKVCSALASRLGAEVAYRLTGSVAIQEQMQKSYQTELIKAKSADAQEDSPEVVISQTYETIRL